MRIHVHELKTLLAHASTDETRSNLCSAHLRADGTLEATDGHRLVRLGNAAENADPPEACILSREGLEHLERMARASKAKVLQVLTPETNGNGALVAYPCHPTSVDPETLLPLPLGPKIEAPKVKDAEFPDTEQLWPKDAPAVRVAVNAYYLKDLAETAIRHARDAGLRGAPVLLELFGTPEELGKQVHSPIRFSASNPSLGEVRGLLMPMQP